jgi:hypothetical protein
LRGYPEPSGRLIAALEGTLIDTASRVMHGMYHREPVFVADIYWDLLWENLRPLSKSYGLQARWSTTFMSHPGKILETFAMYYRTAPAIRNRAKFG